MTTHACHCFLEQNKVSLSINPAFEVSQICASVVYNLNLPGIFHKSGQQCLSVDIKVPIVDGFYISQMNLTILYGLLSDVLLGSDWILLCQPAFIDDSSFISDPVPETIQELPHLHSWQPTNGLFICLYVIPLF